MQLQELTSSGKPRNPENVINVSQEVWLRMQKVKKLRWRPIEEEKLKVEILESKIKPKKRKL